MQNEPIWLLQNASASQVAAVRDVAALTLADFARFPDVFQFDLAGSPTITQLKGDADFGGLYELLGILLAGDVQVSSHSLAVLKSCSM